MNFNYEMMLEPTNARMRNVSMSKVIIYFKWCCIMKVRREGANCGSHCREDKMKRV